MENYTYQQLASLNGYTTEEANRHGYSYSELLNQFLKNLKQAA